jgi:hypothetical protein
MHHAQYIGTHHAQYIDMHHAQYIDTHSQQNIKLVTSVKAATFSNRSVLPVLQIAT